MVGVEEFWLPSFEMAHLQCEGAGFARLTESGVDLVSHSILVLFTRKVPVQSINKVLKVPGWN